MAAKKDPLAVIGIGIKGDVPSNKYQPALKDGIHLRWAFEPQKGFPLHGFYVFRRPHKSTGKLCQTTLMPFFPVRPGQRLGSNEIMTPYGILRSDKDIYHSDKFAVPDVLTMGVDFELEGQDFLEFELSPGKLAIKSELNIDFKHVKLSVDFLKEEEKNNPFWPNFYTKITALSYDGTVREKCRIVTWGPGESGLECGFGLIIEFAEEFPVSDVELSLTHYAYPANISILDRNGTVLQTKQMKSGNGEREKMKFRAAEIFKVVIDHSAQELLLHQISYRHKVKPNEANITASAFLGNVELQQISITGNSISPSIFNIPSGFNKIRLSGGPAALTDICLELVSSWENVESIPRQPIALPLEHPDYPCRYNTIENFDRARKLASSAIKYGEPSRWTAKPTSVYTKGTISIVNNSPIVKGFGTLWDASQIGKVLEVPGDKTAYSILNIIGNNKLILSRKYTGPSRTSLSYTISDDHFGQLYDTLVNLIIGGASGGEMYKRYFPSPVHSAGNVNVNNNSAEVTGFNSNWNTDLAGLTFQIVVSIAGLISIKNNNNIVVGQGTNWSFSIVNKILKIPGVKKEFNVAWLDTTNQIIYLERNYEGDDLSTAKYLILERDLYSINSVLSSNKIILDRPYSGVSLQHTSYIITGGLTLTTPGGMTVRMQDQYFLDQVLLGTLHPAIAQMVGLYVVDELTDPNLYYDYAIVADYPGLFKNNYDQALLWLNLQNSDFGYHSIEGVDLFLIPALKQGVASMLTPPTDVRTYALPSYVRSSAPNMPKELFFKAGLRWMIPDKENSSALTMNPVLYHLWRYNHVGSNPGTVPPDDNKFEVLKDEKNEPRFMMPVISEKLGVNVNANVNEYPPYPLHALDSGLKEGWYSYELNGIDLFGRHSANSKPPGWYNWLSGIGSPDKYKYLHPSNPPEPQQHPFAIHLVDKTPPPPPSGIEAFTLDPKDPYVLQDEAYLKWREANKNVTGIRIRWRWTNDQMLVAPDAKEFNIYFKAGLLNVLRGKIITVIEAGSLEANIATDIPNTQAAGVFKGLWLSVGNTNYKILDSESGTPLRIRIKKAGQNGNMTPKSGDFCSLTIPFPHSNGSVITTQGTDLVVGNGTNWSPDFANYLFLTVGDTKEYGISNVIIDETVSENGTHNETLKLSEEYEGMSASSRKYFLRHPAFIDYGIASNWGRVLLVKGINEGFSNNFHIKTKENGEPIKGDKCTAIRQLVQLDGKKDLSTVQAGKDFLWLEKSTSRPDKAYLIIGVNVSAQQITLAASPALSSPSAWAVGTPFRQYDIFIAALESGVGMAFCPSVENPIVYAHIGISAKDDKNNEGPVGPPCQIFRVNREKPAPPEYPVCDSDKVFASPADYQSHSFYTLRWLPQSGLKTHVFRALDDSIFKTDWMNRVNQPCPPLLATQETCFPPEWRGQDGALVAKRQAICDELNHLNDAQFHTGQKKEDAESAKRYYRVLSNDALRVLAGLPGNEKAFTQITIQPLDPNNPETSNRLGPDNPDDFVIDPSLRIFIDRLDGRSANRYFYRIAYADSAHNRSVLSLSSPPVYLPDVSIPKAPVVVKVVGGDRKIIITWLSNREPNLLEYRIFRTNNMDNTRDLRLMELVHTEIVTEPDPAKRPAKIIWEDQVPGLVDYYYKVQVIKKMDSVNANMAGAISRPSNTVIARAYEDGHPEPPVWLEPLLSEKLVALNWKLSDPTHQPIVQRLSYYEYPKVWKNISAWLESGTEKFTDHNRQSDKYVYRLMVRDSKSKTNNFFSELII